MSGGVKKFVVGTFYHPDMARDPFSQRTVLAYTQWYSPSSPGCVELTIFAESGSDAKREAIKRRLNFERLMARVAS